MDKKKFMLLAVFIFFFTLLVFSLVNGQNYTMNKTNVIDTLGKCKCTNANGQTSETDTSKAMCCMLDKTDWSCTWNGENPC